MGKNGKAKKARARSLSRESSQSESDFSSDWDSEIESPRERRRTTSGEQIRVVVIGGGVSGMSAARGLMDSEELDCSVQLLEARDRAGLLSPFLIDLLFRAASRLSLFLPAPAPRFMLRKLWVHLLALLRFTVFSAVRHVACRATR